MMLDISAIVLTGNEELHIARCLRNLSGIVKDVFIVDSFSTDRTREIVNSFVDLCGTKVHFIEHRWPGLYAPQFNWALDNLPIRTEWVLRLDADELLTDELKDELRSKLTEIPTDVSGIVFKRRHVFCGRWVKAGTYPVKLLRLFRNKKALCEQRMMDEHMLLTEGQALEFEYDFIDQNLNNLSWWAQKHIGYAVREAIDLLDVEYDFSRKADSSQVAIGIQAAGKRLKKLKYARLPLFWRAFVYFCFRYFVKGGWREGTEGFLWHFLQGFWYRLFVDAKIWEIKQKAIRNLGGREGGGSVEQMRIEIAKILKCDYQIDVLDCPRSL